MLSYTKHSTLTGSNYQSYRESQTSTPASVVAQVVADVLQVEELSDKLRINHGIAGGHSGQPDKVLGHYANRLEVITLEGQFSEQCKVCFFHEISCLSHKVCFFHETSCFSHNVQGI